MSERIPDFFLEQYRLGEASDDIAARIEADEEAQARLAQMDTDDAEIFQQYPPGWFADRVRERADREGLASDRSRTRRDAPAERDLLGRIVRAILHPVAIPAVALAVAAALVVPRVIPETEVGRTASSGDETNAIARGERLKGLDPKITVYRDVGAERVEALDDGSSAAAGDHLQIAYRAAGARYGLIFSVDGNGTVTPHFPETPTGATALIQDGRVALPFAYVLDDAPGFEVFYFVASDEPLAVAPFFSELPPQIAEAIAQHAENTGEGRSEIVTSVTSVVEAFANRYSDGAAVVDTLRTYKVEGR